MIKIYQNQGNLGHYPNLHYRETYPTMHTTTNTYTIKVTGKGEVSVKPDHAVIILGVITEDMKVQNAQQQNAVISNKVIDALKNIGIKQDEIETASYSIERIVEYQDSQQVFRGYRVSHLLQVTVKDLTNVGKVIDVATENGANVVRNISFESTNHEQYYGEALQKATLNAKFNAENIAVSLGLKLSSIPLWIVEETVQVIRPQYSMTTAVAGVSTPIQEGQVKITASVQAMFSYGSF